MNLKEIQDTANLLGVNPFEVIGAVQGDMFICHAKGFHWMGRRICFEESYHNGLAKFTCTHEDYHQFFFLKDVEPIPKE